MESRENANQFVLAREAREAALYLRETGTAAISRNDIGGRSLAEKVGTRRFEDGSSWECFKERVSGLYFWWFIGGNKSE